MLGCFPGGLPGEPSADIDAGSDIPEHWIPDPVELHKKFRVQQGDPPLQLGSTGARVRELQATLNHRIADRIVALGHTILLGPMQGPPSSERKTQLRVAYNPLRKTVFQIRGDWRPCLEDGTRLPNDPDLTWQRVDHLYIPEDPLKVDGIYGQHTQAGVAVFQLEQGLPVTGDVDVVTLNKLEPLIPTNRILVSIMAGVKGLLPFDEEDDSYPSIVKTFTSLAATLLILLASMAVYQVARSAANSTHVLARWLFTPESSPWFTALRKNKVFIRGAQFAPALFIYLAARTIFPSPDETKDFFPYLHTFQNWQIIVTRLGLAYMSLVFMLVGFACANSVDTVCNPDQGTDNPIGSIIRAAKRFVGLLGTLLILASLAGRSPFLIAGGLGAFMAVFMLVFKDYLLGLVSSVQIIGNRVVQVGDWISMPKFNADGEVRKISLTLIKIQNFDKTISTVPTSAVLCESFRNWTGMQKSGGRRIKRVIHIDMRSIGVCSPSLINRFRRIELLSDYIEHKESVLRDFNRDHDVAASAVNSRQLTNIGTFRAYLDAYLHHHPGLNQEMSILVRHLQPNSSGLPIEIYAFCSSTEWVTFEAVQADIFDHILAILPEFELRAFQEISDGGLDLLPGNSRRSDLSDDVRVVEGMVSVENRIPRRLAPEPSGAGGQEDREGVRS